MLASRLSGLEGYRAKLEGFKSLGRDEFLGDEDVHQLAARYLQLACECILDLTQHVIAEMGFRQPRDYKDAIEVLREEGVLEPDLAERLQGWMDSETCWSTCTSRPITDARTRRSRMSSAISALSPGGWRGS